MAGLALRGIDHAWQNLERRFSYPPHLPAGRFLDTETVLPGASSRSFWLKGSAWEFPDYENVETFVDRLVRKGVLGCDPLVNAVLRDRSQGLSPRTVRHRFLRATGLSQSRIRQIERAQQAATLLQRGNPISDVVHEVGYCDQPHLTRSLKEWIGHTPAQILRSSAPGQVAVSYKTASSGQVTVQMSQRKSTLEGEPNEPASLRLAWHRAISAA